MKYRPEIDGLRTVAVVPVILFHAGLSVFSGGYVGVDVFFVISGFLITGIIAGELAENRFSLVGFYERRARRILPALFVVILCCFPMAWAVMSPREFTKFAESVVATTVFASNIYFWDSVNYFAIDADKKPLLHTWSLAVEEQYYVFFPLIMMALWRMVRQKSVTLILVAFAVISFALCEWGSINYSWATFYLLPTRAWELLVGALCALYLMGRPSGLTTAHVSGGRDQILSLVGLLGIVIPILFYDSATRFPSVYALPPVLGAGLILLFGHPRTWVGWLLSRRPMVAIGLISYSLYLWHQPLLAFARVRTGMELEPWMAALAIALTVVLATLSLYYVETPFRKAGSRPLPSRKSVFAASIAGIVALSGMALFNLSELKRDQLMFRDIAYSDTLIRVQEVIDENNAFKPKDIRDPFVQPRGKGTNILLLGDSHAADTYKMLARNPMLYDHLSLRRFAPSWKCIRDLRGYGGAAQGRACFDEMATRQEKILRETDTAIISIRWTARGAPELYLADFIDGLREMGIKPVILGPAPEFQPEGPAILRKLYEQDRLEKDIWETVFFEQLNPGIAPMRARVQAIAAEKDVPFLDKWDYQCDVEAEKCMAVTPDGHGLFYDYGHYSMRGAEYFGRKIHEIGFFGPHLPSRPQ